MCIRDSPHVEVLVVSRRRQLLRVVTPVNVPHRTRMRPILEQLALFAASDFDGISRLIDHRELTAIRAEAEMPRMRVESEDMIGPARVDLAKSQLVVRVANHEQLAVRRERPEVRVLFRRLLEGQLLSRQVPNLELMTLENYSHEPAIPAPEHAQDRALGDAGQPRKLQRVRRDVQGVSGTINAQLAAFVQSQTPFQAVSYTH